MEFPFTCLLGGIAINQQDDGCKEWLTFCRWHFKLNNKLPNRIVAFLFKLRISFGCLLDNKSSLDSDSIMAHISWWQKPVLEHIFLSSVRFHSNGQWLETNHRYRLSLSTSPALLYNNAFRHVSHTEVRAVIIRETSIYFESKSSSIVLLCITYTQSVYQRTYTTRYVKN